MAVCPRFVPAAMQYGYSCAVCGFLEAAHGGGSHGSGSSRQSTASSRGSKTAGTTRRRSDVDSRGNRRDVATPANDKGKGVRTVPKSTVDLSSVSTRKTAVKTMGPIIKSGAHTDRGVYPVHHSTSNSETINSSVPTARRRGHAASPAADTSDQTFRNNRGSPRRYDSKRLPPGHQTDQLRSTIAQQANLLALAADAARHNGDTISAQTLYQESADAVMDTLRLDMTRLGQSGSASRPHGTHGRSETRGRGRSATRNWAEWYTDEYGEARARSDPINTDHENRGSTTSGWAEAVAGYNKHQPTRSMPEKRGYLHVEDSAARSSTKAGNSGISAQLGEAGFKAAEKKTLADIFYKHSSGAPALTKVAFAGLLRSAGCPGDSEAYFTAFDRSRKRTWIDLDDFRLGCAALDPRTSHTGKWGSERVRYIFRYYAEDGVKLSRDQFEDLLEHLSCIGSEEPTDFINAAERLFKKGSGCIRQQAFANLCARAPPEFQLMFRYSML